MIDTLTWSLLHFLWQGAAIAAVAGALMLAFRKPASRYLIGMSSLVAMLAAFGITFTLLSAQPVAELPAAGTPAAVSASYTGATADFTPVAHSASDVKLQAATFPAGSSASGSDFRWVAWLWLAGVCVFAMRVVFGVLALEQLRRRSLAELPASLVERFRSLAGQLGIRRAIRFCECRLVNVPAVIGLFRPVVLVPVRALTGLSTEQLEAVIAHELGHVRRLDVIANFFQVIAETLFFFHPAVWWLNKRIRADREDCCDDIAVNATGRGVGYAHALATMAGWRDTPALALAVTGSPVAARVARLLGMHRRASGRTAGVFTATLVLAGALMAGAVSLSLAKPADAPEQAPTAKPRSAEISKIEANGTEYLVVDRRAEEHTQSEARVEEEAEVREEQELVVESEVATEETVVDAPVIIIQSPANPPSPVSPVKVPDPPAAPAAEPAQPPHPEQPAPSAPPARPAKPVKTGSYLDDMKAAGITDLDVDQLIALKVQDVTPEYIRQMRATGLDPSIDEIIGMRVHDVDPAFVQRVREMGYKPDAEELIALKVHDVSAEYVKVMRELGIEPDVEQLIALKSQDVSPEYVREMRSAGFTPGTDELIAMKVHDVTPELRREFEAAGFKLSIEELIQARAMDVTPEFIAKVRAHGFKDLDFEKLVALKNADVL
jgi:beta-lactamase regulating signal transducer with metallopeptidase domain